MKIYAIHWNINNSQYFDTQAFISAREARRFANEKLQNTKEAVYWINELNLNDEGGDEDGTSY